MDYKKKYYKYKTKYLNEVNQKGGNDNINCFICNKTNSKDNLKCWNCSYLLKSLQQQMVLVCPTCGFNNKQTDTNCIIDGTSLSGIILTKSKYCPLVEKNIYFSNTRSKCISNTRSKCISNTRSKYIYFVG